MPTQAPQDSADRQTRQAADHAAVAAERTEDAAEPTKDSADRTVFAAERTYAAWVRTGLAALASGVGAKACLEGVMRPVRGSCWTGRRGPGFPRREQHGEGITAMPRRRIGQ